MADPETGIATQINPTLKPRLTRLSRKLCRLITEAASRRSANSGRC